MIWNSQSSLARLSFGAAMVLACSRPPAPAQDRPETSGGAAASFVNRVWQVRTSSGVEPGTLYAFLSEGTLVIASPHGTPSLGSWKYAGDTLTLVEEGLSHPADVLALTRDELRIRVHSPGPPLEITMTPADTPSPAERSATR
jgi:hypothetical protein